MFGFMKSPAENESNNNKNTITPAKRTSSEPVLNIPDEDDDDDYFGRGQPSKNKHKNLDNMSVQELENYAVNQAEETTNSVNNCLRIAEDIKEDAARTLDTLHQQGEQIHRTHVMAADMERNLSKGEKLLNSLGGMFSMPWKPKKGKKITGPRTSKDDSDTGKRGSAEQREKLSLSPTPKAREPKTRPADQPSNALQKIEVEKAKQDNALDDLSDILGDLKGMAVGMGTELDRQNQALDDLEGDIDELNNRVKGANRRASHLVGK